MPAPVFQAVGTQQNSATASQNVSWPTHQTDDIGLLVIETSGSGTTLTPPSGWAAVPSTPVTDVATTAGSKLHVWWKRAASNAEAAVATGFSTSDHVVARLYTFRGCVAAGNPWDVTTTGTKTTASTTATVPAVTTTVADTLIVMIVGRPDDSTSVTHFGVPTNANLTGLAEAGEAGTNNGNGGGFTVAYGTDATAGNTGTSSISKGASTTDTYVVLALKQPTAYSMTADKATFTLTRRDAGTLYGRKLLADTRSYADTLVDAGLLYGRRMPADVRSFALTGRDAGLSRGYSVTAERATFNDTLIDAGLRVTRRITADKATFTLTGRSAQFPLFARPVKFFLPERNLITRSEEFDNAAWSKSNATVVANTIAAPDGTLTADQFVENALTNVYHGMNNGGSKPASRITYTASAYVKPNGRNVEITISESGGASGLFARLDRTTLTITASGAYGSGYTFISAAATSVGNGWYRISLRGTSSTATTLRHVLQSHNGTSSTYTGDGVSGFYAWGAQLEEGSTLTDYDPTGPAAASRTDLRVARRLTAEAVSFTATGRSAQFPLFARPVKFFLPERNLITRSEEFDNAAWAKQSVGTALAPVVTANQDTAPDGTLTADKVVFDLNGSVTVNDRSQMLQSEPTVTGRTYKFSTWMRSADGVSRTVRISFNGLTPSDVTVTSTWQRFNITAAATDTFRHPRYELRVGTPTSAFASLYLWGAQLEEGSTLTDYDPTGPAAASRTDLRAARRLTADTRSYALTGNDATLTRTAANAYTLTANTGSCLLSGNAAGTSAARKLLADSCSYTLTGQSAGALRAQRFPVDSGSFVVTANAAEIACNRKLSAATCSFVSAGLDNDFLRGLRLLGSAGSFTVTGSATQFPLAARSSSFALSGKSASLLYGRRFAAGTSSYVLAGGGSSVAYRRRAVLFT